VAPDTYTGQGSVEVASFALACHNLGASTTCEMTPPGHSQSTQTVHSDTAHMFITSAIADITHDLHRDCHCTRLYTQARDRNRMLVEPPQDGTQSCLYHIVVAFVGQNMTQERRDLSSLMFPFRFCPLLRVSGDQHTGNEGYDHWACQFNTGQTF